MSMLKIFVVIAVLALIGVGGYFMVQKHKAQSAIQQEVALQQSEKQECERRLGLFYQAWKRYKADHKGEEPPNVAVLIPKYIPDPKLLVCPTAQRWLNNHKAVSRGSLTINKQQYTETYGFQWVNPNAAHSIKKQGDKAPLILCTAHEEGIYISIFHKQPQLGAFDPDKRGNYISELQNARPLVARRNGTVEELSADEE